jgi:hypothetical protein
MCDCAMTSFDLLDMLNAARSKKGMLAVNWDWLMISHRSKIQFFKPIRKIGSSLIWDKATAKKIVATLVNIPYVPRGYKIQIQIVAA